MRTHKHLADIIMQKIRHKARDKKLAGPTVQSKLICRKKLPCTCFSTDWCTAHRAKKKTFHLDDGPQNGSQRTLRGCWPSQARPQSQRKSLFWTLPDSSWRHCCCSPICKHVGGNDANTNEMKQIKKRNEA